MLQVLRIRGVRREMMSNLKTNVDNDNQTNSSMMDIAKRIFMKSETLIILLIMVAILSIMSPAFFQVKNLLNVVRQVSIISIMSMGATMLIIANCIDLGAGSVVALVGVVAATYASSDSSLFVAIIAGLFAGGFVGYINGALTAYGKIPPFIATLGMFTAARGIALIFSDGRPITNLSPAFEFIGGGYLLGVPFPIYIMLAAAIITHILLQHTKFGKHVYAIGGNIQAAIVSGINVDRAVVLIFVFSGIMTAIGGIVLASRLSAGQPTAGVGFELDAIASAVIGGTSFTGGVGTVFGTIVGALIIGVLNNGLDLLNVSAYWQQVLKGIIIVGAVLLDKLKHK